MLESLKQNLQDSPSLRCIVIGSNDKVFSAGHDLKELTSKTGQDYHKTVFDVCSQVMLAIRNMPVPVIAEVKGVAAAAGCQLVAATDIAIASEEAMFSTPGARVGLFCSTPGIEVARAANQKTAAYMLFTGNFITANEALRSGLVSRVVSKDKLKDETNAVVEAICAKSKSVVSLGKKFFYKQIAESIEDAYRDGSDVMVHNLSLLDAGEGIDAFFAKRSPQWTHSFRKQRDS